MKPDKDLIDNIHDRWINTQTREMWIHGAPAYRYDADGTEPGVEYMMATTCIKNLHLFLHQSLTEEVIIHLHTCGGDYTEGMAIYDTICAMPYYVTIVSYTHARSMSSIILQAADKRMMMPNSYFMFHMGELALEGEVKTVNSEVEFSNKQDKTMIQIYADKACESEKFKKMSKAKVRRTFVDYMNRKGDVFLTADEAIYWGLADEVVSEFPIK